MSTGIYCITNNTNGKRYVGKTRRAFANRFSNHKADFRRATPRRNKHLHAAWKLYGESAFVFSILEEIPATELERMAHRETYWINELETANPAKGYNLVIPNGETGFYHTPETKAKLRAAHLGKKHTEETKAKIRANHSRSMLGKNLSDEAKSKIAAARTGTKASPETRRKQSIRAQGRIPVWLTKEVTLLSPSGETVVVRNIRQFCRDNGLGRTPMRKLMQGAWKHYKDWTLPAFDSGAMGNS